MEDHSNLKRLLEAFELSPENITLRMLVVQEYQKLNLLEDAAKLLYEIDHLESENDQLLAAKILLDMGDPNRALKLLDGNSAKILLSTAKCYYMLDKMDMAKSIYQQAIKLNPTLEDTELEKLVSDEKESLEKVTSIANDDTDDSEMNRILHPDAESITFQDVGGLDKVKKHISKKIIIPFQKPSLFQKFRKKIGGGILLYGPPGCGKTLLARATAGECKASFFNVVISDVLDMYMGESEQKLHALFEKAREEAPSVIFFDEIEALAAKRQNTREQTSSKLVSQFLSELDGFAQNNQGVLVLGATNVPWAIDPAFRRPGRFDRVVFIPPPDLEARVDIIKGLLKDRPVSDKINVQAIAQKTSKFSGADLSNLIESAIDEAIDESIVSEKEVPLQESHIHEVFEEVKPTTLEWLTTARNYARYSNESGQYNEVLDFLKKYGK